MSFTAGAAIDEARDLHVSFDPERTPNRTLMRQLNRYIRELYMKAVKMNSTLFAANEEVVLSTFDHDAGHELPAFVYVKGGTITLTGSVLPTEPFHVVPWANRYMPNMLGAGYIDGGYLFLCGVAADWTGTEKIDVNYVPEPTLPDSEDDTVPLPDGAKPVVVAHLAWFMARRQGSYEGVRINVAEFRTEWEASELAFLEELTLRSRGEDSYIREEW